MKPITVKQNKEKDCISACLESLGSYYNLHHTIGCNRDSKAIRAIDLNIPELLLRAGKAGFKGKKVSSTVHTIDRMRLPAVAQVWRGDKLHYIIVYKIEDNRLTVMDPAFGKLIPYSLAGFNRIWSGVLVLLVCQNNVIPNGVPLLLR